MTELALASASLPSGLIAIWKGSINTIPTGWALCNGSNGTPDLRDRFVLGAGNSYSVGDIGGEESHTLTVDEIASHTHALTSTVQTTLLNSSTSIDGAGFYTNKQEYVYSANNSSSHYGYRFKYGTDSITSTGGDSAHNNMPPYYVLCYIMKI